MEKITLVSYVGEVVIAMLVVRTKGMIKLDDARTGKAIMLATHEVIEGGLLRMISVSSTSNDDLRVTFAIHLIVLMEGSDKLSLRATSFTSLH